MTKPDPTPSKDQTKAEQKIEDLPAKDSADASKVKGGFGPVDAKLPPTGFQPVDGIRLT